VLQFHDGADKFWTTNGTKDHEGLRFQIFPSCTLAALAVNGFANCTTTQCAACLTQITAFPMIKDRSLVVGRRSLVVSLHKINRAYALADWWIAPLANGPRLPTNDGFYANSLPGLFFRHQRRHVSRRPGRCRGVSKTSGRHGGSVKHWCATGDFAGAEKRNLGDKSGCVR